MRFHSQGQNHSNDDEDEEFEDMPYDEDEDLDHEMYYEESRDIKMAELSLVEANLNRRILVGVVKSLEKSFWWKFCSHKSRLKMIQESYKTFNDLIGGKE